MRKFLSALMWMLFLMSGAAWAQMHKATPANAPSAKASRCGVSDLPDVLPVYKDGGQLGMLRFVNAHVQCPPHFKQYGGSKRVFISFVVTRDGKVRNVQLQKSVGTPFDEEAVRVVKLLGEFNPATKNGRPIEDGCTIPVSFCSSK